MIGFFDSGIGGLTIIEEVHKLIPDYNTLYLGDSARAPYGNRIHDELVQFLKEGVTWLFANGCNIVIVACNSASASALREVQQMWLNNFLNKKVLGVIVPTVEELSNKNFKNILVLSTEVTAKSEAYIREFKKCHNGITINSHACPNWVSMIEQGLCNTDEMRCKVEREMTTVQNLADVDAVLLACTHFPYIKYDVKEFLQKNIPVFSQGDIVAKSLQDYLSRHIAMESILKKEGEYQYFTTGDANKVSELAKNSFGFKIEFKKCSL